MELRTFNRDKRRHLQDVIGTYNHTFLECFYFFFMVRDTTQELKKIEETRIKHIRVIISGKMTTKIMGQKNILRI